MSRFTIKTLVATLVCLFLLSGSASAQFLSRFEVRNLVIAPGAGVGSDSTVVVFQLSAKALDLSVIVFATDSITPIDTLRAPGPESSTNPFFIGWHGTTFGGGPAPEGRYVVAISATDTAGADTTVARPVFIDVTAPQVQIQSISPSPYAPAVVGQSNVLVVRVGVTGISPPHPDRNADEVQVQFFDTGGAEIEIEPGSLSFVPALPQENPLRIDTNGLYEIKWDASVQTNDLKDGDQKVTVRIIDDAGFSSIASQFFEIDKANPRIDITSPKTNKSWIVLPDSIFGFTMDRNGIDSLRVKYSSRGVLSDVTPTAINGDTVFFAVPLADSFSVEGDYEVTIRATDGVGRAGNRKFEFSFDMTPSAAPVLDPFSGEWHQDTFLLTGDYPDNEGISSLIRVYRNGVQVDSVFVAVIEDRLSRVVKLIPGKNLLTATFVDDAGNESVPSNTITVNYDKATGVFIPAPFVAENEFAISAGEPVIGVVVRIYDLRGDLVIALEQSGPASRSWGVRWHGRNEGDIPVRKGPLVAVVNVRYESGDSETFREIFLYEPTP